MKSGRWLELLASEAQIWRLTLISCSILPLIPSLGEVGIVLVLLITAKQKYRQILGYRLNWAIACLALGLILVTCLAQHQVDAWLGLANIVPFLAMLAVYSQRFRQVSQLRQLAWVLILPVIPIVILGWAQLYAQLYLPNFWGWELIPGGNPSGRMASVFMYANILAVYLVMIFCLNLGLWWETYRLRRQQRDNWRLPWLTFCLLLEISGLILTSSRNAWAIACLAVLVFAFYLGWRWLVWLVGAFASIVLWAAFGPNPSRDFWRRYVPEYIWARLSDEMYGDRPLASLRITQWRFTLDLIQQRPWKGWGLRNFSILYKENFQFWLGHPHNLWLMLMAEIGIPLTLLLSSIVASILVQTIVLTKYLLQSERTIILSYLMAFSACVLFNCLDVSLFDLRVNTLAWLLLSSLNGIVYSQKYSSAMVR